MYVDQAEYLCKLHCSHHHLDLCDIRDQPEGKFNKFLRFEYAEIWKPPTIVETDSDSIVTISDDEILVAQSHSYCYIPGV